jgi:hypothetical protein
MTSEELFRIDWKSGVNERFLSEADQRFRIVVTRDTIASKTTAP